MSDLLRNIFAGCGATGCLIALAAFFVQDREKRYSVMASGVVSILVGAIGWLFLAAFTHGILCGGCR